MHDVRTLIFAALFIAACDGGRPVTPGTPGPTRTSSTADAGSRPADAALPDGASPSDSGATHLDASTTFADAGGSALDASTTPSPPNGAYLYVGAGGGGPSTDLHIDAVASVLSSAGLPVVVGDLPPADLPTRAGLFALMNPRDPIPSDVAALAIRVLAAGGRVLVVMEHCKNGCWGNEREVTAFIAAIGGDMVLSGMGGSPLSQTALQITPVGAVTNDINTLIAYYSGSVDVRTGTALARVPGGDTVIGHQRIGAGELIAVADSSMFGHVLDAGDNALFIRNLATFR